jgi:hypothetical protein
LDDCKPDTEPYTERRRETDTVIVWRNIEWRVIRVRPRAVDSRAVDRRIDEFWIGRLDNNALAFGRYPLLGIGPQRPGDRGLVAKTLDRTHDVSLLGHDGVAELLCPIQRSVPESCQRTRSHFCNF